MLDAETRNAVYIPEGFAVRVDNWWNLIGERQS